MRHAMLVLVLSLASCGSSDRGSQDCEQGVQSCDCLGACTWDNSIHECFDGNWEAVIQCSGTQSCIEEPGELPVCV